MRVTSVLNIIDNKPLRYVAVVAIALAVFAIISICLHRRTTLSTNVSPKVNGPDVTKSQSKGLPHAITTVFTSHDSRTDSEIREELGIKPVLLDDDDFEPTHPDTPLSAKPM